MISTITSKQRAYLKSLAMKEEPVTNLGKEGVTPDFFKSVEESFNTHELIKINVLKNCTEDINSVSQIIAERSHSIIVQIIGRKIVLYKPFKEKPVIVLPT